MLLRFVDAFGKNHRHIKKLRTVATVGSTARATAVSSAFACSKGSRASK
jgi:hypothetical protein